MMVIWRVYLQEDLCPRGPSWLTLGIIVDESRSPRGNFDVLVVVQPLLREPKKLTGETARTMMLDREKFEEFQDAR